jgi:hypothetical protein
MAIHHNSFAGEQSWQFCGYAKMCRVPATHEQARVIEHGGGGADGGKPAVFGMVTYHERTYAWISAKEFSTRTSWKKNAVEAARFDGGKRGISVNRQTTPTGYMNSFSDRRHHDVRTGAAKEIDRSGGLDFFKAVCEERENRGHVSEETPMVADEHSFFECTRGDSSALV